MINLDRYPFIVTWSNNKVSCELRTAEEVEQKIIDLRRDGVTGIQVFARQNVTEQYRDLIH